jgi:hypothetical protein
VHHDRRAASEPCRDPHAPEEPVRAIEKDLTASERDRSIAGLLDPIRDVAGRIEAIGVWARRC